MIEFFIHRPVFATVCSMLIVLAGVVCIPILPIAQFPNLSPPQVSVTAVYNGANSQTVETSVTTLLEQAINGAEGIRYISSSSGNDGLSSTTITFDLDRSLDIAAVDVQNRASTALGRLPGEVQQTGLSINKNSGSFVMAIGFYTEDQRYSSLFISNYLDVYVRDALKRVRGVGDVIIFGERKYAMRLWLDPMLLAKRGLSPADVTAALREQNLQVAAGAIGAPPTVANQMFQISVRAEGRLVDPKQFEAIIIKRANDGSLVQLRDVGSAELGAEGYGSSLTFNGFEALGVGVQQLSNANALEVDRAVREEMLRLSKQFPPGLKYAVAFDTTTAVSQSINEVVKTLIEAIIIVILVIYIFLESWRGTLIPAITIPVSLVGTFAFIKLFGFSINTLTLFGITLATGLVVDDAIVVIENVERHLEEGIRNSHEATRVAMKEVTGAVVATSIVLIAVFVPVSLFPGTTGRMYQQFALTIAFSIALSAFNALTLSPALAALLLRPRGEVRNPFFKVFNRGVESTNRAYTKSLQALQRHKFWVVLVFVGGLALAGAAYKLVPTSFVPDEDAGYFITIIQTPDGSSLDFTSQVAAKVQKIIMTNPDCTGVFAVPGFSFSGAAPNRGLVFTNLKDIEERKGKGHSLAEVIENLRPKLMSISDGLVIPIQPPAIQGLGQFGGFEFEIQQTTAGSLESLEGALRAVIAKGSQRKELRGLFSNYTAREPQYVIDVDREKAKSLGVPFTQVAAALQIYVGSQYINDFDFNNRSYRVYVQADKAFRANPKDLKEYYVKADTGQMVPLSSIITVKESTTAAVISHYNLFRSAEINGNAAPGYSSGDAIHAMEEVAKEALPAGYTFEWTGLSLEEIKSGGQSAMFFGLGLFVVYLVLSALYESFLLPLIILLSVPMAIFGALGAQYIRGQQNDVYCQVGLLMLIGLASKNAILIVEFAEQLQRHGMGLVEAAIEASRLRLRPILMTSIAFILGVLPLVFASGAGSAGRHSVGTTVFGGMIVSTALNLFIIPVLYVITRAILPISKEDKLRGEGQQPEA
jgi:hydrophobic/amphiphilic exporter-1 (mainly G- bacteria), HAE1 family